MRQLALALLLLGACSNGDAGSDCPSVPQPGQACKTEGATCLYATTNMCDPTPEYRCTNKQFVLVPVMPPPSCDASFDAPTDSARETGSEAGSDAGSDAPSDATSSSDG